jgi:hypothetical protein
MEYHVPLFIPMPAMHRIAVKNQNASNINGAESILLFLYKK